jgi:hypothetical protein
MYDATRGYYLRCVDADDNRALRDKFDEVSNPEHWPEGNDKLETYEFECRDRSGTPLCLFSYIDYPGGWAAGEGSPTISIRDTAESSDSVLVLVDGKKVLDLLKGIRSEGRSILDDLMLIVPILQDCVAAQKPMHVFITKSDLIDPRKYPLRKIQDALFKVEPFEQVLRLQKSNTGLHMVPISSVGSGFCNLDKKTGQMIKKPAAIIHPYNVDLSIALTMYDHLKAIADRLESLARSQIAKGKLRRELYASIEKAIGAVDRSPLATFMLSINDPTLAGIFALFHTVLSPIRPLFRSKVSAIEDNIRDIESKMKQQKGSFPERHAYSGPNYPEV